MFVQQIYEYKLNKYRSRVDERLQRLIQAEPDPEIRNMISYAVQSGRRFRPLLFLLAYKVLERPIDENGYQLAAAIELLHKASLLHDDLVDDDELRRGRPSFHTRFGAAPAVIVGDLLVARASLQFERYAPPGLVLLWLRQYEKLCYGELLDIMGSGEPDKMGDRVESIIYGKTASFLEFVLQAGAAAAGGSRRQQELLGAFGKQIGFIFQIVNDWNNWSGFEEQLGRCVGSDLAQGKVNHITVAIQKGCTDKDQVFAWVRRSIEEHSVAARRVLAALNIRNRYTELLGKILEDTYAAWYWVDTDVK